MKGIILLLVGIANISGAAIAAEGGKPEISVKNDVINAADGKPPYGIFDVTASDGEVYREVIRADGTFSSTAKDGSKVEGMWEQREDGIFCSKPFRAPVFRCKYEVVNADGIWTSTEIDGGDVSTIVRLGE